MTRKRKEPHWLDRRSVEAIHVMIAQQSGGSAGLRDAALLESALARPQQRFAYEETSDLYDLAAAMGFGLARNHPFIDGNKRIAFVATVTFLERNGVAFVASEVDAAVTMLSLASGTLDEREFATWLRAQSTPRRKRSR
jgi:death-on-curing protein